jgi:outer membrane protein assembly factor BamB
MKIRWNVFPFAFCTLLLVFILTPPCWAASLVDDGTALAAELLETSGVQGGLIAHLNCGDGRLTAALRADQRYRVHGLGSDEASVATAREHVQTLGLYGDVSIETWADEHLPYADNIVNLLVVENEENIEPSEIMRVLVPEGVALIRENDGSWTQRIKPRPDDIDDWTHYLHGPNNNATAQDLQSGPPRHLQWQCGPLWTRSHELASSISCLVTTNGRVFYVLDEGVTGQPRDVPQQWSLIARDAFNGVMLWKQPAGNGAKLHRRVAAVGDRVYAALGEGEPVAVLNAASGEILYTLEGTETVSELVVHDGVILLRLDDETLRRRSGESGLAIAAYDVETAEPLWTIGVKDAKAESLAASGDRAYYHDGSAAVALDLQTGEEIWRAPCRAGNHLMIYQGIVAVSSDGLQAFDEETGEKLWSGPSVGQDLFGARGAFWFDARGYPGRNVAWSLYPTVGVGLDVQTGEEISRIVVNNLVSPGHHARCYRAKATERYILLRKRGVEFLDLTEEEHSRNDWLRGPCRHGVVPANGLLYAPPHPCFCYPGVKLTGFNVTSSSASAETTIPIADEFRLQRGPAWGTLSSNSTVIATPTLNDWPSYRNNSQRRGSIETETPAELDRIWDVELGSRITQPVSADGRIYVALTDENAVVCLDAASGETLWRFTVDGPIDSSPTLYNESVLFGCSDGRVYCVRASDGELAWRFMAAPCERRIMVEGRLESAWPVHGAVLVQNGLVYCTAGRSSYLDGGISVYALNPTSGEIVHRNQIKSESPDPHEDTGRPFDMDGTRADILTSDGEDLYMFFEHMKPDLTCVETPRTTRMGDYQVGLHLMPVNGYLDSSWFNRGFWTYSETWPGFYFSFRASKSGQILVFDDEAVYAVKAFTNRAGHSPARRIGEGYQLIADPVNNEPVLDPHAIGRDKSEGFLRSGPPLWELNIPVRVTAMVLAGDRLFLLGPPDVALEDDPTAAFEGRAGARLWVVDSEDGSKLAEYEMDETPVFDGMISVDGRIYIATENGRLICMGQE